MKISLDFDSVLADTMVSWTNKFNKKYNRKLTKNDVKKWEFWHDFNIKKTDSDEIFREAWEDWKNLPPTEKHLDQKVAELTKYGTIDVVTSIDESHKNYVQQWLDSKKIKFNELKPTKDKLSLPYDLFIDDSPSLANEAIKKNRSCLVYAQQWNTDIQTSDKVVRINNLTMAIRKIANKNLHSS